MGGYDIDDVYTYHKPKPGQPEQYQKLRGMAKDLAGMLIQECPDTYERDNALHKLEETIFWANASIARHGLAKE